MRQLPKAVTLVELMVGLILIGLVILGLSNIETFSRNIFFNADKRIKVQNDAAFVLQHMNKYVAMGIGDAETDAINVSTISGFNENETVQVWIDSNRNGALDKGCGGSDDMLISYVLNPLSHKVQRQENIYGGCTPTTETLASNILRFNVSYDPTRKNVLGVSITGCANITGCGSSRQNPEVNLTTAIILPSVTTE